MHAIIVYITSNILIMYEFTKDMHIDTNETYQYIIFIIYHYA